MKLLDSMFAYAERIKGRLGTPQPLSEGERKRLPVYLTNLYRYYRATLFDRPFLFAEAANNDHFTPLQYAKQYDTIARTFAEPVLLVLASLRAYDRNRLIQYGVSFWVPGVTLYIHSAGIDLREWGGGDAQRFLRKKDMLSAAAQATVLYHLEKKPIDGASLTDLARLLNYSAVAMMRVVDEFMAHGLAEERRKGRVRQLFFVVKGRELWEKALPLMRSPLHKELLVRGQRSEKSILAGISALAERTMLADDDIPTVAIFRRQLAEESKHGAWVVVPYPEEADLRVELWNYDPALLASNGVADTLSLRLRFVKEEDARVEGAVNELMEKMAW